MLFITKKYLSQNNYSHLLDEFKENFYSHPNYPSLFALTDSLSLLQIENLAVQLPKNQLENLPNDFMAKVSLEKGDEMVLVKQSKDGVQYFTEAGKKNVVSLEAFKKMWNGLVVAVEKNKDKKTPVRKKGFIYFGAVIGFVFIASLLFTQFQPSFFFFQTISILGLIASFFILEEKYEERNEVMSKICNFNPNTSCSSIIQSTVGKDKWFDFTDLPILFFSISFLAVSLNPAYAYFIGVASLISIPVIGYSIYIQVNVLKKWCVLCLFVSALLLVEAFYFAYNFSSINFTIDSLIEFALIAFLMASAWFYTKSLLEKNKTITGKNTELSRFKKDYKLFDFLAKETKGKETLVDLEPIELGNKKAPLKLSLFLSPSCGYCHTAYKDAMDLIEKYPDKIKVWVFYNLNPENKENPYTQIAKNTLQIEHAAEKAKEVLDDWHIERMELKAWLKKWGQSEIDAYVEETMNKQYEWCKQNELNYTPVKLIGGRLFPYEYQVEELKYFLNDLIDENKIPENKPLNNTVYKKTNQNQDIFAQG